MINNIRFKIIAGKINKMPEFYTIFARKMPDYMIRRRDRGQAEAKCLRPRLRPRPKFWPGGHFGFDDLTSLLPCHPLQPLLILVNVYEITANYYERNVKRE